VEIMDTSNNLNELISEEQPVELKTENEPINDIPDSDKTGEVLLFLLLYFMVDFLF